INAPWNGGAALRESAEKSTTAFAPLLSIMAPGGMVLVLATQSLRPKHWSDKSSTVRPGSGFGAGPPGLTSWKEIVPKLFRVAVAAELASRKMIWPLLLMVDAPALLFPRNTTLLLFVTVAFSKLLSSDSVRPKFKFTADGVPLMIVAAPPRAAPS